LSLDSSFDNGNFEGQQLLELVDFGKSRLPRVMRESTTGQVPVFVFFPRQLPKPCVPYFSVSKDEMVSVERMALILD
jgi:hypothetical protein